jgi:hypothetical protein
MLEGKSTGDIEDTLVIGHYGRPRLSVLGTVLLRAYHIPLNVKCHFGNGENLF